MGGPMPLLCECGEAIILREGESGWSSGATGDRDFCSSSCVTWAQRMDSLRASLAEAETALGAWHSVFGTTQLTHAKARLEAAERQRAVERETVLPLPCPWCGVPAVTSCADPDASETVWWVEGTGDCDVLGPNAPTESAAIAAWNRVAGAVADRDAALLRGIRLGLEAAAVECDERAALNDAVEGAEDKATDPQTRVVGTACEHRAIEARECAFGIRALDPEAVARQEAGK